MKTLHKPEIAFTLLFLAVSFLVFFHSTFLLFLAQYLTTEEIKELVVYLTPSLIIACSIIIFFGVKNLREKIISTHTQYYYLFERNPAPMAIVDVGTRRFLAVNNAALDCYGYSTDEFFSMTIDAVKDAQVVLETEKLYTGLNFGMKPNGMSRHRKKNGDVMLVEVSSQKVTFKNKKCLLLLARDITEIVKAKEDKRIAEEEKVQQQNFTSYVLENFPVDVAIFDKDHKYILLNRTAVKNDEMRQWMIGKDDFDYFERKGQDKSMAEKRRDKFNKAVAGDSKEWVDKHIVDGKMRYMLRKFYPYYEKDQLKYVYGYGMDITEIKNAQIQREEYIQQLERMAFTTSHKIRQPICNLQGLISLLEMEKCDSPRFNDLISCMQKSITNMDDFTRELAIKLHEYKQTLSAEEVQQQKSNHTIVMI